MGSMRTIRHALASPTWRQRWCVLIGYYRNDPRSTWPWWQRVLNRLAGSPWP